jgi:hypothetical protein
VGTSPEGAAWSSPVLMVSPCSPPSLLTLAASPLPTLLLSLAASYLPLSLLLRSAPSLPSLLLPAASSPLSLLLLLAGSSLPPLQLTLAASPPPQSLPLPVASSSPPSQPLLLASSSQDVSSNNNNNLSVDNDNNSHSPPPTFVPWSPVASWPQPRVARPSSSPHPSSPSPPSTVTSQPATAGNRNDTATAQRIDFRAAVTGYPKGDPCSPPSLLELAALSSPRPLTLCWLLLNDTTVHSSTALADSAVASPPLPSLPEPAASPSQLLTVSLPLDQFGHHTSGVGFTFLITLPSICVAHFESRIADDDFECVLASCCGYSISLRSDAPARRGRFISSGPCHVIASLLCFGQEGLHPTSSFLCFGQEGLHPTLYFLCFGQEGLHPKPSSVSLLCLCGGREGLRHLISTSGNFSQTPLESGQGSTAVCSFLFAPGQHIPVAFCNGHHIPVAFCNLLRCLSTTTDSFMFLSHITPDSTTTTGFYMPATAFSALPRTTSCFNFFSFAASLLVWNGMLSCAVYALRARRSLLPGANINCRNSIYDNVSLPNVGVFDYLKSAPPGTPCLCASAGRHQLPWPIHSGLRRRLCLFSDLAVSIRL